MLERLHNIDWSALTHAYGPAVDVPELIQALTDPDPETRADAYWELYGTIFHQGTRYPATAPAIPFLLELLADPATPDRHDLLLLLTHLVTGPFGVAADPALYAGESDGHPHDDRHDRTILRDVYCAAERGLPVYLDLLCHGDSAHLRAAAAFMLASLWTRAATTLPRLRAQLAHDPHPAVRATLAFALGRLQDIGVADPSLVDLHAHDPAPLVRLLAALGLLRAGHGPACDLALTTLIAAIHRPDSVPGYDQLPCGERDLASDLGHVARTLPAALGLRALELGLVLVHTDPEPAAHARGSRD